MDIGHILHVVLLPKLEGVKNVGGYFMARCPAHEDRNPSLSIKPGNVQPVVLNCHANCATEDILTALGLTWQDISLPESEHKRPQDDDWTPIGPASDTYDYRDEAGHLLFQVLRIPLAGGGKTFRQRVPDSAAKAGWRWKLDTPTVKVRRVLYRLPQLIAALEAGQTVWIAEGEKDVHALVAQGVAATCNPGGAGKWLDEFTDQFVGATVRIAADGDRPGQAHARQVAADLAEIALSVTTVESGSHKDVAEHLAAGKTLDDLLITWSTEEVSGRLGGTERAPDLHVFLGVDDPPVAWVIPGLLERGDRLVWTGFEGLGKAVDLETPIPTPKGWTTMGALTCGDEVFSPDGSPVKIVATSEVMCDRRCYRVRFSDGAEIVADAEHLWLTETVEAREAAARYSRKSDAVKKHGTDQKHKRLHFPKVLTTREIAATVKARGGHTVNHSVETCAPLQYPSQELPIPPYVLGAWLGDGNSSDAGFTCADQGILDQLALEGEPVRKKSSDKRGILYTWATPHGEKRDKPRFQTRLRELRVLNNKHIPERYLHASIGQRLALLQGLMDTDGTIGVGTGAGRGEGAATAEFCVCSKLLAEGAYELLLSLGVKVTWREGPAKLNGRVTGTRYRLAFQTDLPIFRLQRKLDRVQPLRTRRAKLRYITSVEPVPTVPVRCITVANPDGMFVAGRECIPTHNSVTVRQIATAAAAGVHPFKHEYFPPRKVLFIDCENSERQGRRHFRKLEYVARMKGHRVPDDMLFLVHQPAGVDLTKAEDAAWLIERVTAHEPDLLVCGPFYRLHGGDSEEEKGARRVVAALDAARIKADCALIVEHHAPHGSGGAQRSVRPFGSSLLLRWPEMGMGIMDNSEDWPCRNVTVSPWRGNRDERDWPRALKWGEANDDWPWVVDEYARAT